MTKSAAQGKEKPPSQKQKERPRKFDALVKVGTTLSFDPTGEKLRITKIEGEQITFEKLP